MTTQDRDFNVLILGDRARLQNPYAHLVEGGNFEAVPPQMSQVEEGSEIGGERTTSSRNREYSPNGNLPAPNASESPPTVWLLSVPQGTNEGERTPKETIESIVQDLQRQLWTSRSTLFPDSEITDPLDVLDPLVALRGIGFHAELVETLGQHHCDGSLFEVAGVIDAHRRRVHISCRFSRATRNFTAAHELGHAVLHQGIGLHRDRPVNGSRSGTRRNSMELDADVFAGCFLIPQRMLRVTFERTFGAGRFVVNEETAFALNFQNADELRSSCRSVRDLSCRLASARNFDGSSFNSLAVQFRVSVEAMAIRLEELNLVEFP